MYPIHARRADRAVLSKTQFRRLSSRGSLGAFRNRLASFQTIGFGARLPSKELRCAPSERPHSVELGLLSTAHCGHPSLRVAEFSQLRRFPGRDGGVHANLQLMAASAVEVIRPL